MNRALFFILLLAFFPFAAAQAEPTNAFLVGAGGFDICRKDNRLVNWTEGCSQENHTIITELLANNVQRANAVSMWITKDWDETWYPAKQIQQDIIDRNYTPIFIFYWFGDNISIPYIAQNRECYFEQLKKFSDFLAGIKGEKIVILNPEFNQNGVQAWQGFNDLLLESFRMVKKKNSLCKVGFCIGDFGNYEATNDIYNWELFDNSINRAVQESDFIAFQEMRALTRNKPEEIAMTPLRAFHFAAYLHKKYKKPTMLAYLAISSYGADGLQLQEKVLKGFQQLLPRFKEEAHLIGFNYFNLSDCIQQKGYFQKAEQFFGLFNGDGRQKPACKWFNLMQ
jgi:hypothetical protein